MKYFLHKMTDNHNKVKIEISHDLYCKKSKLPRRSQLQHTPLLCFLLWALMRVSLGISPKAAKTLSNSRCCHDLWKKCNRRKVLDRSYGSRSGIDSIPRRCGCQYGTGIIHAIMSTRKRKRMNTTTKKKKKKNTLARRKPSVIAVTTTWNITIKRKEKKSKKELHKKKHAQLTYININITIHGQNQQNNPQNPLNRRNPQHHGHHLRRPINSLDYCIEKRRKSESERGWILIKIRIRILVVPTRPQLLYGLYDRSRKAIPIMKLGKQWIPACYIMCILVNDFKLETTLK